MCDVLGFEFQLFQFENMGHQYNGVNYKCTTSRPAQTTELQMGEWRKEGKEKGNKGRWEKKERGKEKEVPEKEREWTQGRYICRKKRGMKRITETIMSIYGERILEKRRSTQAVSERGVEISELTGWEVEVRMEVTGLLKRIWIKLYFFYSGGWISL